MQIHRPRADGAAAGQRDPGVAHPGEDRADGEEGRPHLGDQLVGGGVLAQAAGVEAVRAPAGRFDLDAQGAQDLADDVDVGQLGDVGDVAIALREDRRGQDRQGRVLRAADRNGADERGPAVDNQLIQALILLLEPRCCAVLSLACAHST
ncbi:hypothetical protein D3C86_1086020 [compost metagenome]